MPGTDTTKPIIRHTHDDGRVCILSPDGRWMHWDEPTKGPLVAPPDPHCRRDHPIRNDEHAPVEDSGMTDEVRAEAEQAYKEAQQVDAWDGDDYSGADAPKPTVTVRRVAQRFDDEVCNGKCTLLVKSVSCPVHGDRGEFGTPTLGAEAGKMISELKDAPQIGWREVDVTEQMRAYANVVKPQVERVVTIDKGGLHFEWGEVGNTVVAATDEAAWILERVPDILQLFLEKNEKYAEVQKGYDLGVAGIIPDVNRKLGVLIARHWHDAPTVGEDSSEVITDLIGHLLLMLAKLERD